MIEPRLKTVRFFILFKNKTKHVITIGPSHFNHRYLFQRSKNLCQHRNLKTALHSIFTLSGETNVVYPCNEILLSNEGQGITGTHVRLNGSRGKFTQ